jgi:hypothetical protein
MLVGVAVVGDEVVADEPAVPLKAALFFIARTSLQQWSCFGTCTSQHGRPAHSAQFFFLPLDV